MNTLFTTSGVTTTPFSAGATLAPTIRIFNSNDAPNTAPLPRSAKTWSSNSYLTSIFGEKLLNSIPTIEIVSGSTDYLDLVQPSEFVDENNNNVFMAKGIDPFGRHFVTMGFETTKISTGKVEHYIYTFFRRYTDGNTWVICKSHYSKNRDYTVENLLKCSTVVYPETIAILKNILNNYANENNTGIELSCEGMDGVLKTYNIRFYQPNNIL